MRINIDYRSSNITEKVLSNLQPCTFTFLDVNCNSVEGVLQSLKFSCPNKQLDIVRMSGFPAKMAGKNVKYDNLCWFGMKFDRHSNFYQDFINELLFCSFEQNTLRQKELLSTKDKSLAHTIGCNDPYKTILTVDEFIKNLNSIRYDFLNSQSELPDWLT